MWRGLERDERERGERHFQSSVYFCSEWAVLINQYFDGIFVDFWWNSCGFTPKEKKEFGLLNFASPFRWDPLYRDKMYKKTVQRKQKKSERNYTTIWIFFGVMACFERGSKIMSDVHKRLVLLVLKILFRSSRQNLSSIRYRYFVLMIIDQSALFGGRGVDEPHNLAQV